MSRARVIRTWNETWAGASDPIYTIAELLTFYRNQRSEQVIDGCVQKRSAHLALFYARGDRFHADRRNHRLGMPVSAWYRKTFIEADRLTLEAA